MKELASFCHSYDACELDLLPVGWQGEIRGAVKAYGMQTCLDGMSSTSRELPGVCPMRVTVVTGEEIIRELPWLYKLYTTEFAAFARRFAGSSVILADDVQSSVNINLLEGSGARYERHVDSNPVTGILFSTTLGVEDGGELAFECAPIPLLIRPHSGMFIVFDARDIVHHVMPLKRNLERVSIPMNYYLAEARQRPVDLDDYLYTRSLD